MLLVADIGNSNITFGLFNNDNLLKVISFAYSKDMSTTMFSEIFKQLLKDINFSECAIGSVADEVTSKIYDAITIAFNVKPIILTDDIDLCIGIKAKKSQKFGIDRIANICAISKLYSGPVIVVDCGTATTFDIMDENKSFIGGIIMPGIGTQLKSLETNTSKLPHTEPNAVAKINRVINTDTENAILTGVIKGHTYAVEGLLHDCIKELGTKPVLVATGGHAELVKKYMKKYKFDRTDISLTLRGFQILYNLNSD